MDFNETRRWMAVASAASYANRLHLTSSQHLITKFFTDWMLFLMPMGPTVSKH